MHLDEVAIACATTAFVLAVSAPSAEAEERAAWQEWSIDGVLILGWAGPEMFKSGLAPETCRWCDEGAGGVWSPPGIDRGARGFLKADNTSLPALFSDIVAFGLLPGTAAAVSMGSRDGDWPGVSRDLALVTRGVAVAALANQAVKYSVGRRRPYAHFNPPSFEQDPDQNLSFYSGHTNLAFSTVTGLYMVLEHEDSPWAPWVLVGGLPIAAGVGALRIAADKHYLTDVLTGALLGAGFSSLTVWLSLR